MSSIDILRSKRATGYGGTSQSTESKTGSVNRSFPLTEEELMGLGEGPCSLRAKGHVQDGHFHVYKLEKDPGEGYDGERPREGDADDDGGDE
jgi:hypothetical protein